MAKRLHKITITENRDGSITTETTVGNGAMLYGMLEYARRHIDRELTEAQKKKDEEETK